MTKRIRQNNTNKCLAIYIDLRFKPGSNLTVSQIGILGAWELGIYMDKKQDEKLKDFQRSGKSLFFFPKDITVISVSCKS